MQRSLSSAAPSRGGIKMRPSSEHSLETSAMELLVCSVKTFLEEVFLWEGEGGGRER
uniref:Uncharacterized protein n=1 Tax=Anguilla anguilla TaxID=7936 RepID=A0A0E9UYT6_ANGAN